MWWVLAKQLGSGPSSLQIFPSTSNRVLSSNPRGCEAWREKYLQQKTKLLVYMYLKLRSWTYNKLRNRWQRDKLNEIVLHSFNNSKCVLKEALWSSSMNSSMWLTCRIWSWHHSGPACRRSDRHMTAGAAGSCLWPTRTGGGLSHLPAPCTENSHHTNQQCTHLIYSQCTWSSSETPNLYHSHHISTNIHICKYLYLHVYEPTEELKQEVIY